MEPPPWHRTAGQNRARLGKKKCAGKSVELHRDLQVQKLAFFTTFSLLFAKSTILVGQKALPTLPHFAKSTRLVSQKALPKPLPQEGGGREGAFPPPKVEGG